jgi:membrane protein involved in colicin uptake
MSEEGKEMVLVEKAELDRLRAIVNEMPAVIERVKQERDKERLKELSQRHKENPEQHRQNALNRYYKNKEEINAKRREAYKKKKAAEQTASV